MLYGVFYLEQIKDVRFPRFATDQWILGAEGIHLDITRYFTLRASLQTVVCMCAL